MSLVTLQHRLDAHMLRLLAEADGWSLWVPGERLGRARFGDKRPDAIAMTREKVIVAVEVERTIKSRKRYEEIISHYLRLIKKGEAGIKRVIYVCPDGFARKVERIFCEGIKSVPVRSNGLTKRVGLTEEHRERFVFLDYTQWPGDVCAKD